MPDSLTTTREPAEAAVIGRLSTLDRFLPVWIIVAMTIGLGLGRAVPTLSEHLDGVTVGSVSLPIALGLVLMSAGSTCRCCPAGWASPPRTRASP